MCSVHIMSATVTAPSRRAPKGERQLHMSARPGDESSVVPVPGVNYVGVTLCPLPLLPAPCSELS
jgi:hypothetical protein